ncbi:MAG: lipopolysaccharide transport periplasmic protein LptA [Methylomonas sp.]|nr:lipopolysaccharide transport periplasmic protein LptA [Methylomonas sp.]PPD21535.1 MAG: lipopolysaccharide transport periplasmic protein LptA [Methylomonas sp.]PPD26302.1 MAG: lipopolysaccharide transport periplasmic protein LptA [Methylomonas sp.]PPD38019.1 MAG: lipopolysaccharide transport periplasmic protein LptA [Methylomonas sp.]PPD38430.1 MAG: lipopolysaccharide transport periplasmic protein LptA [Methylomonas sp.]
MKLTKLLIGLVLLLIVPALMALESDAEQPVYIDSDHAMYDEKAQTSTYIGNVVATQGSIKINADKLVVNLKNGGIDKLVATGNPSRFKQLPAVGKEEMHGEGQIIEFHPEKNLLIFMKNASVWQGDAKQSSERIEYDTKNSLLKAGESNTDGKRVHSVIKPKPAQ